MMKISLERDELEVLKNILENDINDMRVQFELYPDDDDLMAAIDDEIRILKKLEKEMR